MVSISRSDDQFSPPPHLLLIPPHWQWNIIASRALGASSALFPKLTDRITQQLVYPSDRGFRLRGISVSTLSGPSQLRLAKADAVKSLRYSPELYCANNAFGLSNASISSSGRAIHANAFQAIQFDYRVFESVIVIVE